MIIKKLINEKISLFELILIAIIIGLSIELISNGLNGIVDLSKWYGIIFGCILLLIGFSYFVFKIIKLKTSITDIRGFIIYNSKNNNVVDVPRYKYSEELSEDLKCAFNENPALKKIWDAEPFSLRFKRDERGNTIFSKPKSYKLIIEATEYFILKQLSLHLSSYFNNSRHDKKRLQELNRRDIPTVLLDNRFLELFSKPMEQRDAFVADTLKNEKNVGKVVASYRQGYKFEQFDLVLPKNSKVSKPLENELLIETSRLKIKFSIDFQGMGTVLPYSFEKFYLNHKNHREFSELQINIHTTVRFKAKSFLSRKGWEYFEWVDSFNNELIERFSEKRFFEKINWNTMSSAIIIAENMTKLNKENIEEVEIIDSDEK